MKILEFWHELLDRSDSLHRRRLANLIVAVGVVLLVVFCAVLFLLPKGDTHRSEGLVAGGTTSTTTAHASATTRGATGSSASTDDPTSTGTTPATTTTSGDPSSPTTIPVTTGSTAPPATIPPTSGPPVTPPPTTLDPTTTTTAPLTGAQLKYCQAAKQAEDDGRQAGYDGGQGNYPQFHADLVILRAQMLNVAADATGPIKQRISTATDDLTNLLNAMPTQTPADPVAYYNGLAQSFGPVVAELGDMSQGCPGDPGA